MAVSLLAAVMRLRAGTLAAGPLPLVTGFLAVLVASRLGGFGPGLASLAMSFLLIAFTDPAGALESAVGRLSWESGSVQSLVSGSPGLAAGRGRRLPGPRRGGSRLVFDRQVSTIQSATAEASRPKQRSGLTSRTWPGGASRLRPRIGFERLPEPFLISSGCPASAALRNSSTTAGTTIRAFAERRARRRRVDDGRSPERYRERSCDAVVKGEPRLARTRSSTAFEGRDGFYRWFLGRSVPSP